jgi:hypothetical protein
MPFLPFLLTPRSPDPDFAILSSTHYDLAIPIDRQQSLSQHLAILGHHLLAFCDWLGSGEKGVLGGSNIPDLDGSGVRGRGEGEGRGGMGGDGGDGRGRVEGKGDDGCG